MSRHPKPCRGVRMNFPERELPVTELALVLQETVDARHGKTYLCREEHQSQLHRRDRQSCHRRSHEKLNLSTYAQQTETMRCRPVEYKDGLWRPRPEYCVDRAARRSSSD